MIITIYINERNQGYKLFKMLLFDEQILNHIYYNVIFFSMSSIYSRKYFLIPGELYIKKINVPISSSTLNRNEINK